MLAALRHLGRPRHLEQGVHPYGPLARRFNWPEWADSSLVSSTLVPLSGHVMEDAHLPSTYMLLWCRHHHTPCFLTYSLVFGSGFNPGCFFQRSVCFLSPVFRSLASLACLCASCCMAFSGLSAESELTRLFTGAARPNLGRMLTS